MRDKLENITAATLAAAVVLSPTLLTVYAVGFIVKVISVL